MNPDIFGAAIKGVLNMRGTLKIMLVGAIAISLFEWRLSAELKKYDVSASRGHS
jgi:hypothetical protein